MRVALLGIFLAVLGCATANWCCGDVDTKDESKLIAVTRSRTIHISRTEYYKLKSGYKPCPNNTIAEKDVPKGFGSRNPKDTKGNRITHSQWFSALLGSGKLDNGDVHDYCPTYTTKSRSVVAYKTEYYTAAVFDDDNPSCSKKDKMCCRGYKLVGENCVEEKKAEQASGALDFLKSLGVVG